MAIATLRMFGVTPPTKISPATGKETYAFSKTDEGFKALLEHEDERIQAIVAARLGIKSTLEETRTQRFIEIADRGFLPIPLRYYAAHTGRWGGDDKVNLQNLPRQSPLKYAIIAPTGHMVIDSDSSQIEARVLAWLSGQEDLVTAFREGKTRSASFKKGQLIEETKETKTTEANGTLVSFVPDTTVFKNFHFIYEYIESQLWNYCYLNAGLSIYFNDKKFISKNGLLDLLERKTNPDELRYPIIHLSGEDIEVAISHNNDYGEDIFSFVNGHTIQNGLGASATVANVYPITQASIGNVVVATTTNSTGKGYAFTTTSGVIFKKGFFFDL